MTFSIASPHGYLIGDTGRRAKIVGAFKTPGNGRRLLVMAENGLGGEYEEVYRLDGSWPFNELGNFNLRNAPSKLRQPRS